MSHASHFDQGSSANASRGLRRRDLDPAALDGPRADESSAHEAGPDLEPSQPPPATHQGPDAPPVQPTAAPPSSTEDRRQPIADERAAGMAEAGHAAAHSPQATARGGARRTAAGAPRRSAGRSVPATDGPPSDEPTAGRRGTAGQAARMPEQQETPLDRLTTAFAKLPGIGRKSAEKLAYHVLRCPEREARALALAIEEVRLRMVACSVCAHLTDQNPCAICSDSTRDRQRICVVEQPRDVFALEKSGSYRGLYHVLGGRISPLEGVGADDLTVAALRQRVAASLGHREPSGPIPPEVLDDLTAATVTEVILATNPDFEGDGTALVVREALADLDVVVTQLARGIPQGSNLEYVSSAILADAMRGRRHLATDQA